MKKVIAASLLSVGLALPLASLGYASAGDANQQGPNGTVTGAPAPKTAKKHHGHHHKKTSTSAPQTPGQASAPATK
ncbi:MAG TPA: hypothetical protein VMU17_04945 [Elusimicrobiota bacterium]|nr:hypothetical protein [Elusimicrobiota bacterium]